jgi:hypothetical protein
MALVTVEDELKVDEHLQFFLPYMAKTSATSDEDSTVTAHV